MIKVHNKKRKVSFCLEMGYDSLFGFIKNKYEIIYVNKKPIKLKNETFSYDLFRISFSKFYGKNKMRYIKDIDIVVFGILIRFSIIKSK